MSSSFTTMENMDSIYEEQMEKMLHIFDIPPTKDDIPTSTPGEKIKLPKLTIRLTPKVSSISSVLGAVYMEPSNSALRVYPFKYEQTTPR